MLGRLIKDVCHLVKEGSEKNENSKHVSGVMRFVLRFAVRTNAADRESDARVDSNATRRFNACPS